MSHPQRPFGFEADDPRFEQLHGGKRWERSAGGGVTIAPFPTLVPSRTPRGGWRLSNQYAMFLADATCGSDANRHYGPKGEATYREVDCELGPVEWPWLTPEEAFKAPKDDDDEEEEEEDGGGGGDRRGGGGLGRGRCRWAMATGDTATTPRTGGVDANGLKALSMPLEGRPPPDRSTREYALSIWWW